MKRRANAKQMAEKAFLYSGVVLDKHCFASQPTTGRNTYQMYKANTNSQGICLAGINCDRQEACLMFSEGHFLWTIYLAANIEAILT